MWLPQFPGSNIGKPACCRTAACMMGKAEILPYALQFLSSTTHIPGNCAEGGETAPARIPRHIPESRSSSTRLPAEVEPQPLGADSALSEPREQHHGQLPRSLGSARLSAPETVERRRNDRVAPANPAPQEEAGGEAARLARIWRRLRRRCQGRNNLRAVPI